MGNENTHCVTDGYEIVFKGTKEECEKESCMGWLVRELKESEK